MKRGYSDVAGSSRPVASSRKKSRRAALTRYVPRPFSEGEWKYYDISNQAAEFNSTGAALLMNGLVPGTGASQRIGQKIICKSFEIRIAWSNGEALIQRCRAMLFIDRQPNGAIFTATDLLTANAITGLRNLTYRKRFKILWDWTFESGITAGTGSLPAEGQKHFYIKFRKPFLTEYNTGNAGTIADISTNSLYLYFLGDGAAGNGLDCTVTTRFRYTDN